MRTVCFVLLLAALAAGGALAFTAAAAQAAGGRSATVAAASGSGAPGGGSAAAAGQNIGGIIKAWGSALLLAVAGLMGLTALARRSVGEGVTLLVITLIVGGFVYAPEQVKHFIEAVWRPLSGT